MREHEEILLGGMFRPTEQNCPTREGELIESLDKIHDIPNPRVGMRVYVENTGREYIIKSLKEKTIGGVNVPGAAVETLEETVSEEVLGNVASGLANQFSNIERNIKANALQYNKIGFNVYADRVQLYAKNISDNDVRVDDIPAATPERAGVMSAEDKRKLDAAGSGATKILWDASSNMNDFKTPGVYEIYGERTVKTDNLPIANDGSGHSIAARLTVVASTLQPANNEICVTQFLMLSNRLGGEGNMYVRTYNENNSPAPDWWTPWQKLQGVREGYIFTDTIQVNPDGGVQQIEGVTGLNNMIDNGIYSGIYTDDPSFQAPTFIDTFTLIVINNYAVANQSNGQLKRTISQLKYAVDAITNQATVKQRTKTDGSDWTDWTDIGGGGSQEVDITDAVKQYGLPYLYLNNLAKDGIVYSCKLTGNDIVNNMNILDNGKKLSNFLLEKDLESSATVDFKIEYKKSPGTWGTIYIDIYLYKHYYKAIITGSLFDRVYISADFTEL